MKRMENTPYWNPLVPELTVASVEASLRFYRAAGFAIRYQRDDPPFAYLELGGAQLMLEQQHPAGWNIQPLDKPLGRGVNFQILVPSVQACLSGLQAVSATLYREPKDAWYQVSPTAEEGRREFLVQDPDGYLLRFAQSLGQRHAG